MAAEVAPSLAKVREEIEAALADGRRGERVRAGFKVALIGAPNAGKSSLLNVLVGRDAAIVTATPGTTRDVIEAPLTLAGYRVHLADTAGVRASADPIEVEGVRRAREWAADADLRLLVIDGAASDDAWREVAPLSRAGDLCLLNKSDKLAGAAGAAARAWADEHGQLFAVSAAEGGGLEYFAPGCRPRSWRACPAAIFRRRLRRGIERTLKRPAAT